MLLQFTLARDIPSSGDKLENFTRPLLPEQFSHFNFANARTGEMSGTLVESLEDEDIQKNNRRRIRPQKVGHLPESSV